MSKQANKTMIGIFVVGAMVLVISGIMIFGSGRFFKEHEQYVLYFDGSVKGLNVGSALVWRGVKVGSVTDIILEADPANMTVRVPVFVEFEQGKMKVKHREPDSDTQIPLKQLIELGLRAQLQMQSMVTGQLMINLDFYPDTPVNLVRAESQFPEIPTIPSSMEALTQIIEKIPIREIFEKLTTAVEGVEKLVNSPETMEAVRSLNETLDAARNMLQNIDKHVNPVATSLDETIRDTQKLVRNANDNVDLLASTVEKTAKAAGAAVTQAQKTLITFEHTAGEDSPLTQELLGALKELSDAASSIRSLTDYLQQHPESLLRGKGGPK